MYPLKTVLTLIFLSVHLLTAATVASAAVKAPPKKAPQAAKTQNVIPSKERTQVLDKGNRFIRFAQSLPKADYRMINIPFSEDKAVPAGIIAEALTDEEILKRVAQAYRPKGVIMRQNSYYLVFNQGAVKEGGAFGAKILDKPYRIEVPYISQEAYVLRYRQAFLKIPLTEVDTDKIKRD